MAVWTDKELDVIRCYGRTHSSYELHEMVPTHSRLAIAYKCRRIGVYKTHEFKSRFSKLAKNKVNVDKICKLNQSIKMTDLNDTEYQVLLGSLLGDGCVRKNGNSRNCVFCESHGLKQSNYVLWKKDMLSVFKPTKYPNKPEIYTGVHPIFTSLRKDFYGVKKHKCLMPGYCAKTMGHLALLVWYLDDGNLNRQGKTLTIASSLFSMEDLQNTVDTLNINLGLSLYIKSYPAVKLIVFNKFNRGLVRTIWKGLFIKHSIPECMSYKLDF